MRKRKIKEKKDTGISSEKKQLKKLMGHVRWGEEKTPQLSRYLSSCEPTI